MKCKIIEEIKEYRLVLSKNTAGYAISTWKESKALIFFKKLAANCKPVITINGSSNLRILKNNEFSHIFYNQLYKIKNYLGSFSIDAIVKGGGVSSQMQSLALSLYKILFYLLKKKAFILKKEQKFFHKGKKKERKKFGHKKARKGFQYSKR